MLTMLDVIVLDVLPALILGLVIALLLLVFQASRPRVSMLERGCTPTSAATAGSCPCPAC